MTIWTAFTVTVRAAIVDFKITALKVNKFHGEIELEIIFFYFYKYDYSKSSCFIVSATLRE